MMRCECWRGLRVGHSPSFDLSIDVQKPFEEWLEFEAAGAAMQLVPNVRQQETIDGNKIMFHQLLMKSVHQKHQQMVLEDPKWPPFFHRRAFFALDNDGPVQASG